MIMKQKEIKKVALYIRDNFNVPKMKLQDYLVTILGEISTILDNKYIEDDILEFFHDGIGYKKLVTALEQIITKDVEQFRASKINIFQEICFEYIECTNFGSRINNGNRDWLIQKLYEFDALEDKEKGDQYEEFCACFFEDIGFQAHKTRSTNDAGIDILGSLEITSNIDVVDRLFGRLDVNLICQVKYRNDPVDTPTIRHLIGDSLFFRFQPKSFDLGNNKIVEFNNSPTYLVVISHNGFTTAAYNFAKTHGILLFDSRTIVDILCSLEDWNSLKAVKMFSNK